MGINGLLLFYVDGTLLRTFIPTWPMEQKCRTNWYLKLKIYKCKLLWWKMPFFVTGHWKGFFYLWFYSSSLPDDSSPISVFQYVFFVQAKIFESGIRPVQSPHPHAKPYFVAWSLPAEADYAVRCPGHSRRRVSTAQYITSADKASWWKWNTHV